jgi:hypothetical protein
LAVAAKQGRSKVVPAFGRKPLNFRIPSGLAATLEQRWAAEGPATINVALRLKAW